MTHTLAKTLALSALSLALAACGGGSSSSKSTNTQTPPSDPVAINESNLEPVLAVTLRTALDSGLGVASNQPHPINLQGTVGEGTSRVVVAANNTSNKTLDSATGLTYPTQKSSCAAGGTAEASIDLLTGNTTQITNIFDLLQVNLNFDFDHCKTGAEATDFYFDGAASLRFYSLLGSQTNNSTLNLSVVASLNDFSFTASNVKGGFGNVAVTGKVNATLSNPNMNSLEARFWIDGGSNLSYHPPGSATELMRVEAVDSHLVSSLVDSTYKMTANGTYTYAAKFASGSFAYPTSKITFSTPTPFSGHGFVVPDKGVLRIEDGNKIGELRVLNDTDLQYVIYNRDGSGLKSFHSTWAQFLNAQPL